VLEKPYIFFPLQVNKDTQIKNNSPYSDMYQILDAIVPLIRNTEYNLIIKEHPKENTYTSYSRYRQKNKIFVVKNVNLDKLIEHSEAVVTVNSSVGLQAIEKYKKVMVLGSAFYTNAPSVHTCNLFTESFLSVLANLKSGTVNKTEVDKYIAHCREEIFIEGNWSNPDKKLIYECICRIVA